jgi:hypothetical protein
MVWKALLFLAAIASPVMIVVLIHQYRIDAPYHEQWYFLRHVERMYRGQIDLSDLWEQEAEHRHLFPYALMLLLARLSHWQISWELASNFVLAGITSFAIAWRARQVLQTPTLLFAPIVTVFIFSAAQFECWLWGFEMVTFMNITAAVAGMAFLTSPVENRFTFPAALAVGVVSCYSFANGFAYWPAAGIALCLNPAIRRRRMKIICWLITALLTAAVFMIHYHLPQWSAPANVIAHSPGRCLAFFLVYLGNPVFALHHTSAALAAVVAIIIFATASIAILQSPGFDRGRIQFFWSLAAYVLLSGALISSGRANFGQAISPRYITTTCLFWISLCGVLCLLYEQRSSSPLGAKMAALSICTVLLLGVWSSIRGIHGFRWYHHHLIAAQNELFSMKNQDNATPLFPANTPMPQQVSVLRQLNLSVFHDYP